MNMLLMLLMMFFFFFYPKCFHRWSSPGDLRQPHECWLKVKTNSRHIHTVRTATASKTTGATAIGRDLELPVEHHDKIMTADVRFSQVDCNGWSQLFNSSTVQQFHRKSQECLWKRGIRWVTATVPVFQQRHGRRSSWEQFCGLAAQQHTEPGSLLLQSWLHQANPGDEDACLN